MFVAVVLSMALAHAGTAEIGQNIGVWLAPSTRPPVVRVHKGCLRLSRARVRCAARVSAGNQTCTYVGDIRKGEQLYGWADKVRCGTIHRPVH